MLSFDCGPAARSGDGVDDVAATAAIAALDDGPPGSIRADALGPH